MAHTAAQAAIRRPGITYNPFFIYGDTGRGKTHLIQAIGNQYKKLYPTRKVFYLTSDRFGNEYTDSLQAGTANRFKEKYRQYDLLIIDDVQFFSKKEKMQEELFHLFNSLYDNNKQIIFSSDRAPVSIPDIADRLRGAPAERYDGRYRRARYGKPHGHRTQEGRALRGRALGGGYRAHRHLHFRLHPRARGRRE